MNSNRLLLVGDNPFQGISHLSQERAVSRGDTLENPNYAAELIRMSVSNGADGFMFTVSESTLAILREINKRDLNTNLRLYAIVPYMYEFVRLAVVVGGIPGLAKKIGTQIVLSHNLKSIVNGMKAFLKTDVLSLLKSYMFFEIGRIKSVTGRNGTLEAIFLHESITDMVIALEIDWIVKGYITSLTNIGIKPGFHTHNLPMLIDKFETWGIDFNTITLTAQFNSAGFQMTPTKEKCEEALNRIPNTDVIGYGILASGYLSLNEAITYIRELTNLTGIAVGVSKESHAQETFRLLREKL